MRGTAPARIVSRVLRWAVPALLLAAAPAMAAEPGDGPGYQRPPDPIPALLAAPARPFVLADPTGRSLALFERPALPSIAELATPELSLAGQSIDPRNNGPARASAYSGLVLLDIAGGASRSVALPADARIVAPVWAPDGEKLAFLMLRADEVELWVASADGRAQRLTGGVNAAFPKAFDWRSDSRGLTVRLVPADRGAPPEPDAVPSGPLIEETAPGRPASPQTLHGLLRDRRDEALFEHYFTSRLAFVGLDGSPPRRLGAPGLILDHRQSPDGRYLLVRRLKRPFSRTVAAGAFPMEVEVLDLDGAVVRRLADLPVREAEIGPGPRAFQWREDADATLAWVEAGAVGGDRLLTLDAPFVGAPTPLVELSGRFGRVLWGRADVALVVSAAPGQPGLRTLIDPSRPGSGRPYPGGGEALRAGFPATRADARGREVLHLSPDGARLLVTGARPGWLDLTDGAVTPLPAAQGALAAVLDQAAESLLVWRESRTEPPNLFVGERRLTDFPDPAPAFAEVSQRTLGYVRSDGVPLSAELFLPAGYRPGVDAPLPVLVWAYPSLVERRPTATRTARESDRFVRPEGFDDLPLYLLTQGYAVLRPSMPVVADGVADILRGYPAQLVANAEAALAAAAATGAVDRDRAAIGGWSFGASMAASLLAHSDLFRAGVSISGAYNRTLTPFGFQASERRTYWEAPEAYREMSAFEYADRVDEPLLLMHGAADSNSGTQPQQSERFFAALKANGATARYVVFPHEAHAYVARESLMHALWEMTRWLDLHVKGD